MAEEHLGQRLTNNLQAELDAISYSIAYPKGALLFAEGEKASGAFLLHKGRVKLSAGSAEGRSMVVGRAEPGAILGLPSAISGKANEVTAEALHPVDCGFIARHVLVQFLRENGEAAVGVATLLSGMYEAAFNHIRYLGLSASATEKLARLLLDLSDQESQSNRHAKIIPPTHKEIAEMIGLSRETVTRLFARFKREQLVGVHDSHLHILDRAGLEQLLAV
jgi:CRP/FNR family transcriptional regulator, cyclic AMP receptor protein